MPKPSNAYVPRKGAAEKTYTNADGKKVKYYSVGEDDKKKAGSGERPAPIVPGKSFTKAGPNTVSDRTVEPERSRAKEQAFKESRMDFTPTAKRTTGKTYQEQQNEKNMMGSGGAVKPGQRNPSYVESKPAAPETEKPEEPRRTVQYETGTPAFLETPIPALPPMNYLTGDMDKQVQQMYRDKRRQDVREMPEQLYDTGKPFPNTVKPGQMNGSYTEIPDKEPDNRPYRERINSLQDDLTEEVRQRQWMEQANAEYSQARADALHELNMEDIWAMPIEDREELRKYVDADVERRARMGASGPIEFYARDKAASEAFAPLEEKYGEQRAKELAEAMEWYLSEKETERVREYGEKLGHGNFAQKVGGNVLSIAANTAGSITGPMGYLDEAIHRTGQYPTLNPNNMGMTPEVYAGAVREATAQDIEGENGNWFRKGLSYAYQGTMSAADSLARLAVAGEAGGLALAGLGQFGSAVSEASARGASPGQAVCYGVTTASVEVLTEKIPMDDWLKIAKGGKQPLTVAVKNAFKQAGVEISTEEISFVADLMLDATIMQGKSGYNQQVRELEAQGYSRTDAENMASKALLWEAFDTLMVSGFSGGGSSAVGSVIAGVTDSGNQQDAKAGAGADQVGQKTNRDVQGMTDDVFGVQQPQITPAQQEQQTGPQQGPQAAPEAPILAQQGLPQTGTEPGQPQAAEALTEDFQQRLDGQEQQARDNQDMFDQAAEIAPQVDTGNVYAEDGQVGDKNLSAAETGFSGKQGYYDLLTDENAQRDRPGDVRPMEMPKTDINGGKVSEVTGNVYGSKITTDEMANLMEKPTAKGYFSYVQISNDQASQMAMNTIAAGETWDNAFDFWKSDVDQGKAGAEMSARAAFLLNHFAEIGDKKQWLKTLHYTQMLGTNTAQGLQALRLIRELNPQDKVAFARMTIQRAVTDLTQKYKTAINMEGAEPLFQALEQAETDEQRDVIIEGLQKYVADQVPSTALDKFTALRYTNMLGNLRTMGRNVAGNVAMAAQYRIKDTIAAGMEQIANVLTDGKVKKTKSVTVGKDLMNACRQDFQQFSSIVSDGGKYGDRVSGKNQFMQGVEEKRTIFKTKLVEAYRKGTNWAMNNQYFGDEAFGREGYARALAGYLKANGVKDADLSKVDGKLMDEARAYAIQQAQEATFHDSTALARVLSKLQKDTGVVGQGILPFVKTPANVLVRGEEFSPLGFINSTVKTIEGIQGKATGAEIIDSWAKTLTGTGLFALGAFLKSQGWIGGGPDDDEDKENFDKMNGNQPYSLNLPWGGSYTMDWLNPTGIPLFMGAQFQNLFSKDYKDITFADLEEVFTSVADPMIQMSMLQGLNDSLDNIKYSGNNLGQFFLNAGVSYLTQGLQNTMLGQIEKSFEKERTYTYVDKDSQVPAWMQKALGKVSQKFPGWDYHQVPYRNGWGEKEEQPTGAGGMAYNMLSPGYYKAGNEDPVNKELQRLNEEEGLSSDIFPGFQVKKMTWTDGDGIEHKDYNMDAREADRFQETAGKTAHTIVSELLKKEEFKALSPGDKERAIKNAYDYAQEKGREEALDGYQVTTSWMQGVDEENAVDKILARSWSGQNRETTFSDKVQKEMDALEASVPEAKGISEKEIPETVTVAGEEELLSLEQRQQYAEVYDKKVNEYCDALVSDPGFQQLSGEGKTEALKKAKEYAADHAKAAVSDFSDVQKGFGRDVAVRIVNDVALKSITDIFGDIDTNTKKGSSNADNLKALDAAYDRVLGLPEMQRDKVLGDAESDAARYFDARESGVETWDFIQARDAVNSAEGSGSIDKDTGKPKQTNADKYEAIAGLEQMTDDTIDSLMKAWMPDYDPDNGKTDRAELKYDYARKELRLSPSQYAEAYRVNGQYSLKDDKVAAFEKMGFDKNTALQLYKLYGGSDKKFNQKLVELYGG